MAKHITIRLWDEVLAAVDKVAAAEERDRTQVINRTLRDALGVWEGTLVPKSEVRVLNTFEKKLEEPRYRKCQHGGNEYTCERVACKLKTGRA